MLNEKTPLVSVLMNCHNCEKYLKYALKSILDQSYKNWELVFLDNNSNDNSKNILNKFSDKRIKYYKTKKFLKLGEARKLGWELCKGKYIAILDADDIADPERLEKQIEFFNKNNDVAVYGSSLDIINNDGLFVERVNCATDSDILKEEIVFSFPFMNSTLMINKKIGDELGGLDPNYEIIHDHEFVYRISKKFKISNSDKVFSKWRKHEKNISWKKMLKGQLELAKLLKIISKDIKNKELLSINTNARALNSFKISYLSFKKLKFINSLLFFIRTFYIKPNILFDKKIMNKIQMKLFN